MAITKPVHGAKIKKSGISGMHDEARAVVNDLKGVNLGRDSLGPQALPSVVKAADFSGSTTMQTVDSANEYLNGSLSDITTNWKLLSGWTTTGPGVLPPCKVLVYFNCRVSKVESTVSPDEIWDLDGGASDDSLRNIATRHQLWLALGYHNGTSEVFDLTDTGVVFSGNLVLRNAQYEDPDDFSQVHLPAPAFVGTIELPDFPTAATRGHFVEHPVSFWMVIDQTAASGNWTLQDIRVRAASRGATAIKTSPSEESVHHDPFGPILETYTAPRWTLLTSQIGYIAFEKDE